MWSLHTRHKYQLKIDNFNMGISMVDILGAYFLMDNIQKGNSTSIDVRNKNRWHRKYIEAVFQFNQHYISMFCMDSHIFHIFLFPMMGIDINSSNNPISMNHRRSSNSLMNIKCTYFLINTACMCSYISSSYYLFDWDSNHSHTWMCKF